MKGRILDFSVQENTGVVSGEDGKRYHFGGADWRGDRPPDRGVTVDFDAEGNSAKEVYIALGPLSEGGFAAGVPNKITAGLLAFFFGMFGVHKFYLGFTKAGIIMLVGTLLMIPAFITVPLALIEAITYLTKSDEEFERLYVIEKKQCL